MAQMSGGKRIKLEEDPEVKYETFASDCGYEEASGVEKIICGDEEYLVMSVKCEVEDEYCSEGYEVSEEQDISGLLSSHSDQLNSCLVLVKNEVNSDDDRTEERSSDAQDALGSCVIGKNGYVWTQATKQMCTSKITPQFSPAVLPSLNLLHRPQDIFTVFFPPDMITSIVTNTNIYIKQLQAHSKPPTIECDTTDAVEINALLGLLVLTGAMNMNHVSVSDLFDPIYSGNIFKCTFTQDRFQFLQNSLRFGNQSNIDEIKQNDQFAEMRFTWEQFVRICRESFSPGSSVTIGEHCLPFSGQCSFKKANPGGTDYIKLMVICDSQTKYMFDAFPHMGKGTKNMSHVRDWIKKLTRSIQGSRRSVIVDGWPVPLKFASELLAPPFDLTIVAPTPHTQPPIPTEAYNYKKEKTVTSKICCDSDKTLLLHMENCSDLTLLVSTLHRGTNQSTIKNQPDILHFYNENKAAIESFDQMCKRYSCSRISGLWPLCIFHGMINIACVNSYIIYRYNRNNHRLLGKRDFMKRIAQELIKPHLRRKQSSIGTQSLEETMQKILAEDREEENTSPDEPCTIEKRTICRICPPAKRRMTVSACRICRRPYCREHRGNCCSECSLFVYKK